MYMYVCMLVCMYVCMYGCMYGSMHVRTYVPYGWRWLHTMICWVQTHEDANKQELLSTSHWSGEQEKVNQHLMKCPKNKRATKP